MTPVDRSVLESALAWTSRYIDFQCGYVPFVGAQVAARLDGELIFSHAAGFANVAAKEPMTTDHLFRIASHSKTFTAVAIMQLVEAGRLRLDDPVSTHVSELTDADMGIATIRELLSHMSGMIRDGDDCSFWALERPFPDAEEVLRTVREQGKIVEPNEHYKYSNVGFSLLGLVIERVTGVDYREYVSKNIVERLGLKDTGPDLDAGRERELARGYSSRAHGPERAEIEHIDTRAESSATGFFSDAEDVTAYFSAHLDGDERLLSDASKRRMRRPHWKVNDQQSYGLGLSISEVNGRTYYGHSGGYPGHITMSRLDLDRRLALSVFTNTNDGPAGVLSTAILKLMDLALDSKHEAKTDPQPAEKLEPFEGRFADLWGVSDVANLGGRLYLLHPTLQDPAAEAIELEVVSENELKVVGDSGAGGYGELMRYTFADDRSVEWLRGPSGHRLVPAERFQLGKTVQRPA